VCAVVLAVSVVLVGGPDADADDLATARARANEAARSLAEAEDRLTTIENELAELERQAADARARLDGLAAHVQAIAVDRYVASGRGDALFAVGGADINRQVQADALVRLLTQGNDDAVDEVRAAREDLERAEAATAARVGEQRGAVETLRDREARLMGELRRLEELERERQAEEARRAAAARPTASGRSAPSTPIATGSWICPVQGPRAFTDTWGAPRSGGRTHQGVDIMSPTGTPVVAPVSGNVSHRANSIGGLSFHLDGDDGHYYYGTHLSEYANGGHVAAGTVIGFVGESGNATTPHLHFEIHPYGGAAVNPYPTVAAHC
jgi:murein DD-endopeptidase MepM/ murein hydrolase activator NlpD